MSKTYDAIIVGGALSGSRAAELLAKQGKNVLLIEEHSKIGLPCKCTGLVSWRTPEMLKLPKKLIVNKLNKGKFYSPNKTEFTLTSKKTAYVLDRPGLDRFIFNNAVKEGAETKTEHFIGFHYANEHVEVKSDKGTYQTKVLVGADGANSLVAQNAKLEQPKNIFVGMQTTATGDYEQFAELWFGSKVAPNFFAWVVPENDSVARIGVASHISPKPFYEKFLMSRLGHNNLKPDVAGVMRVGLMKDTVASNVLLVGDAACQIKPFSGGGITYGLIAAQICADAVQKAFNESDFSYKFFKQHYDFKWKEKLAPAINKAMLARKILYTLQDSQVNVMFRVIQLFGYRILTRFDFDLLSG